MYIEFELKKKLNSISGFYNNVTLKNTLANNKLTNKDSLFSSGVYKLSCSNCDSVYIGQTGLHFKIIFKKHWRIWINNHKSDVSMNESDVNKNQSWIDQSQYFFTIFDKLCSTKKYIIPIFLFNSIEINLNSWFILYYNFKIVLKYPYVFLWKYI